MSIISYKGDGNNEVHKMCYIHTYIHVYKWKMIVISRFLRPLEDTDLLRVGHAL